MKGKKRFVVLDDAGHAALQLGHKEGAKSTFRQRCHLLLLSDRNKTIAEIAELLQITRQSIGLWFDRYEEFGIDGLRTAKGGGRPSILKSENPAEVARIKAIVSEHTLSSSNKPLPGLKLSLAGPFLRKHSSAF